LNAVWSAVPMNGYNNLVVDMLGFFLVKNEADGLTAVMFDVTHSLQRPREAASDSADGRPRQGYRNWLVLVCPLGLSSLFLERTLTDSAKCGRPVCGCFGELRHSLKQMSSSMRLVKPLKYWIRVCNWWILFFPFSFRPFVRKITVTSQRFSLSTGGLWCDGVLKRWSSLL